MESPFLGQGKYCGTTIPTVEKTSSNHALVGEEINFLCFSYDAKMSRGTLIN